MTTFHSESQTLTEPNDDALRAIGTDMRRPVIIDNQVFVLTRTEIWIVRIIFLPLILVGLLFKLLRALRATPVSSDRPSRAGPSLSRQTNRTTPLPPNSESP
jgi:hypothetical protein